MSANAIIPPMTNIGENYDCSTRQRQAQLEKYILYGHFFSRVCSDKQIFYRSG